MPLNRRPSLHNRALTPRCSYLGFLPLLPYPVPASDAVRAHDAGESSSVTSILRPARTRDSRIRPATRATTNRPSLPRWLVGRCDPTLPNPQRKPKPPAQPEVWGGSIGLVVEAIHIFGPRPSVIAQAIAIIDDTPAEALQGAAVKYQRASTRRLALRATIPLLPQRLAVQRSAEQPARPRIACVA